MHRFNDNPHMVSTLQSRWAVAGSTFVLWALVAGSAVYWGLKLAGGRTAPAAPVALRTAPPPDPAAVARLLGYSAQPSENLPVASMASRFALLGVVASRDHGGTALIAVDGKPAKPFAVGAAVGEGLVLQSVEPRRAVLASSADGPAVVALELPRTGAAATGVQPAARPIPAPR
jgi:general secretion pathway protein C